MTLTISQGDYIFAISACWCLTGVVLGYIFGYLHGRDVSDEVCKAKHGDGPTVTVDHVKVNHQ